MKRANKLFSFSYLNPVWYVGEEGGGTGKPDPKAGDKESIIDPATHKKLQDDNAKLTKDLEAAKKKSDDTLNSLLDPDYIKWLETQQKGGDKVAEKQEVNLDELTPTQLHTKIMKDLTTTIDGLKSEMGTGKREILSRVGAALAQIDIAFVAKDHDDFMPNFESIYKIATENPAWNAERCYKEFKRQERETQEGKDKALQEKEERERNTLTENPGEAVPSITVKGKQLTKEEAGDLAYKKIFGSSEKK